MKKVIRIGMLLAVVALTGQACKKSSNSKSKTEYLTQSGWKTVSVKTRTSTTAAWGPNQLTGSLACELDDLYIFKADGKYDNTEGATKCSPSDPQLIFSGVWSFQDGETKINVDGDVATIDQLDDNTMVTTDSFTIAGTTTYTQVTFSH